MGYSTDFKGRLEIVPELTASQLAKLSSYLGEDVRDHKEWGVNDKECPFYFIDLQLTKDFKALEWNGSEKTYGMVEAVNFIIQEMRKELPAFSLVGHLLAQGDDIDDRWTLVVEGGGLARKVDWVPAGRKVECPECGHQFYLEDNKS